MGQSFLATGIVLGALLLTSCHNQQSSGRKDGKPAAVVGGGCDGCELMYIGMPREMGSVDTSPGWKESGQQLIVTGKIFRLDGRTPAPDVIIYYWQTDNNGYYSAGPRMDQRAKRHGHIRGWVKTDTSGKYTIRTIRPSPYPGQAIPAHIHLSVKEPGIATEYYPDDINFDDDPLLLPYFRKHPPLQRGGTGVVRALVDGTVQIAEHNIILGLNIPGYPVENTDAKNSGLNIGEDQPSFTPFHAFGPDKGTKTCPVCKYGRYHGIIYYVGNAVAWEEIKGWLTFLEQESLRRQKYLKVYFVYGDEKTDDRFKLQQLEQLGTELGIRNTALTFVPSFGDEASEVYLNRISQSAKNTFVLYKHGTIVDKYTDLAPTQENFRLLSESLDRTKGEYFNLNEVVQE